MFCSTWRNDRRRETVTVPRRSDGPTPSGAKGGRLAHGTKRTGACDGRGSGKTTTTFVGSGLKPKTIERRALGPIVSLSRK